MNARPGSKLHPLELALYLVFSLAIGVILCVIASAYMRWKAYEKRPVPEHVTVITGQVLDVQSNAMPAVMIEVHPMETAKIWNKVLGVPMKDMSYHIESGSDGCFSTSVTGFAYS